MCHRGMGKELEMKGRNVSVQERAASLAGRSGSWAASLTPGSYKQAFMHALRGRDVAVSAAAVRVLCGCLLNKSVDPDILDAAGDDWDPSQ